MLQAPTNNIIVSVKSKYIQSVSSIVKLSSIQNGATVDIEDLVQIVGEIVSIPKSISKFREYEGYSTKDMQIGDTIIFSYQVIHDMMTVDGQDELEFRNLMKHEGKEYFLCNIKHAFAVIRNKEIIMVNGYVMLNDIEKKIIKIPNSAGKTREAAFSEIIEIGHSRTHLPAIPAKKGDTVFFNENIAQRYEIGNKKFIILQQEKILGSKNN